MEAAQRSGSLITARLALEQNREVYAVPGPALDAHCLGCQDLVRQGARAVFCAEDMLRDLAEQLRPFGIDEQSVPEQEEGLQEDVPAPPPAGGPAAKPAAVNGAAAAIVAPAPAPPADVPAAPPLNATELAAAENAAGTGDNTGLIEYLRQHGPTHADILADAAGLSAAAANAALVGLEMLGKIRRLPGARYEAVP